MAAGLPIVAKYAPNLAEYITNNENGILVKYDAQISKNIITILTNEQLATKLSINALKSASLHSSKEFGDKLEQVYLHVIQNYKKTKEEKISLSAKLMKFLKSYK